MKNVLVIEDNEDNIVLITRLLEKSGYKVMQAKTGLIGYEMAISQKPDFILLDIQLPDIEGIEVLHRIRANKETEKIIVIAVTSYAMEGDRERLLGSGCNGYIEKPIDPLRVINQIQQIIGDKL